MSIIHHINSLEFTRNRILSQKNNKKIYVIISSYGERESELIHDKLLLLQRELGTTINKVFLSHRRIDNKNDQDLTERKAKEVMNDIEILLCNNIIVPDMGSESGKGADMRRSLYYINTHFRDHNDNNDIVIIFLDADTSSSYFGIHFIFGLAGAVIEGYHFAKAGYHRALGRVKKFVAQPLFSAINHPKLVKLSEFSYPLSGEVAGTLDFFNKVHFWQMYGIETGILIESCMDDYRIVDVNFGHYDHVHNDDFHIQKMAFSIIRTYLKQLVDHKIIKLNENAIISDTFRTHFIGEDGQIDKFEYPLSEIKYAPLYKIL